MIKIEIYKLSEKGEILSKKEYLSTEFNEYKFDDLSLYVNKTYKQINPAFVFCFDLKIQDTIQVLRGILEGQVYPDYQLSDGSYYFRCGNLLFFVDEGSC